jgi:hypothetical protein
MSTFPNNIRRARPAARPESVEVVRKRLGIEADEGRTAVLQSEGVRRAYVGKEAGSWRRGRANGSRWSEWNC